MTTYKDIPDLDPITDPTIIVDGSLLEISIAGVSYKVTKAQLIAAVGGIPEAPDDGVGYVRQSLAWAPQEAGVFPVAIQAACSDETTAITTGAAKITFRAPYAFTLTAVRASLTTASSSGLPEFDIKKNGVSVLSTQITIDVGELTSTAAATPPVIATTAIADDDQITIDFNAAGTGATGVKIALIGTKP